MGRAIVRSGLLHLIAVRARLWWLCLCGAVIAAAGVLGSGNLADDAGSTGIRSTVAYAIAFSGLLAVVGVAYGWARRAGDSAARAAVSALMLGALSYALAGVLVVLFATL